MYEKQHRLIMTVGAYESHKCFPFFLSNNSRETTVNNIFYVLVLDNSLDKNSESMIHVIFVVFSTPRHM